MSEELKQDKDEFDRAIGSDNKIISCEGNTLWYPISGSYQRENAESN
jgi:hypothetical protein